MRRENIVLTICNDLMISYGTISNVVEESLSESDGARMRRGGIK